MFSQFKSRISYYYEQKYLKSATKQPLTFFLRRTIPFNLKAKNIYFERYRNRNRIDNNGESVEDHIVLLCCVGQVCCQALRGGRLCVLCLHNLHCQ